MSHNLIFFILLLIFSDNFRVVDMAVGHCSCPNYQIVCSHLAAVGCSKYRFRVRMFLLLGVQHYLKMRLTENLFIGNNSRGGKRLLKGEVAFVSNKIITDYLISCKTAVILYYSWCYRLWRLMWLFCTFSSDDKSASKSSSLVDRRVLQGVVEAFVSLLYRVLQKVVLIYY